MDVGILTTFKYKHNKQLILGYLKSNNLKNLL